MVISKINNEERRHGKGLPLANKMVRAEKTKLIKFLDSQAKNRTLLTLLNEIDQMSY